MSDREKNFKDWLDNVRQQIKELKDKRKNEGLEDREKLQLKKLRKVEKRILEEI